MQQNSIQILCTRPLEPALVREAKHLGIDIDSIPFIEIAPIQTVQVQQEIAQAFLQSAKVVFTSMNAVDAIANELLEDQPDWSIYCIGTATQKLVTRYFGEETIAGTAPNATELAQLIADEGHAEEVIFFCGDQRRDELPDILRSHNIEVHEIEVYQTIALPHKIRKAYHGVLFFSPTAVQSFFRQNKLPAETILFAIGSTTAAEIRKFSTNNIIISDEPGKESLVRKMMEYFS